MSARADSTPSPEAAPPRVPWREQVRVALRGEGAAWLFVFKTLLSVYLAGLAAMRLELASPSTAMLTVLVVMHRQSGMVLAKSFYRALGTVVGSIAAIAITALFPQQPLLFLLALSVWVGLCAGGAMMFRNFRSYGFVLSGYTVAIIALPAVDAPTQVFDLAVTRVSEVLLGLLVSGVVFDVVFPSRLRNGLRNSARGLLDGFLDFVRDGTLGALPRERMEQAHLRFVRESMALEDLRASVVFEDPEARVRSQRLRLLNQRFMAVSTRFQSLHHFMNRLLRSDGAPVAAAIMQLYRPLGDALRERGGASDNPAIVQRLDAVGSGLPGRAAELRTHIGAERWDDFDTGVSLLVRFCDELRDTVQTAAALRQPGIGGHIVRASERVHFSYATDPAAVAVTALRSFLVSLLLGLAWIQSGWTSGAAAMTNVIAFTAILAAQPNPAAAARQISIGYALGALQAFLCVTLVLPQTDSYGMLVLGTLPLLIWPVYLSTRADHFGLSLGACLGTMVTMGLGLMPMLDTATFLNNAVAFLAGALLAFLAFRLMPSVVGSAWQRRRLLLELRRQVTMAARAPLQGLAPRFESVSRDLLLQVVNHTRPNGRESRTLLAWALAVHETGRTLIELRHDSIDARLPTEVETHIDAAVHAIARLYDRNDRLDRLTALRHLDTALAATVIDGHTPQSLQAVRQHLHLLRSALRDAESVLGSRKGAIPTSLRASAHAS